MDARRQRGGRRDRPCRGPRLLRRRGRGHARPQRQHRRGRGEALLLRRIPAQPPALHLPQADRGDHGRDHDGRRRRHLAPLRLPHRHREHAPGHARDRHRTLPGRRRRLVPAPPAWAGWRVHGAYRRASRRRRMPLSRACHALCRAGVARRHGRPHRDDAPAGTRADRRLCRNAAGIEDRAEPAADHALLRVGQTGGNPRRARSRRRRLGQDRARHAPHEEPTVVQGLAAPDGRRRATHELHRRDARRICARRARRQDSRLPRGRLRGPDRQERRSAMGPGNAGRSDRRNARRPLRPVAAERRMDALPASGDGRMSEFSTILVEQRGAVTLVTLNRPQALNALNSEVLRELTKVFAGYDADRSQRCLVLTGSEKAFAAGADIKEMSSQGFADMYTQDFFAGWERITATRKPWIAAVAGYALGGGCEVAMMADIIIAAETAKFGQPEIKLGVTPGMGGSQRLTWAVGKAKAMEMCLTGRMMDAAEAERSGLVAKVVPADQLLGEAMKTAEAIAAMPPLAAIAVKEMVNAAFEIPLSQGIRFERRLFHGLFGTEDQKEGMTAFVEKRAGNWKGR